ncbi:hypothetical protein [Pseudoalteromonas arctica]|uniref:Uncharacterized protein n=1 Tax=Pseudoalteromonas arctica TaxID=394751 RepID=A0A7Y0DPR4_9GAMM|nr:hypothetical protein [Pseudoalteromonas arctica]NMM39387.1 hypothetical protein [Pseudoalteromonas arctica]
MDITNEELNFISDLFQVTAPDKLNNNHTLTLQSAIPANIAELLHNTKLTLLAEVGDYQLWFPLKIRIDKTGVMIPILSAPEVIDTQGIKRCWRSENLNIQSQGFKVESISSTGVFLKLTTKEAPFTTEQQIKLTLPNKKNITINIEPVRFSKRGMAAKITHIHQGKEHLRAYLFEAHKRQNANLYESTNTTNKS